MAATPRYWVVSLPVQDSASILWGRLQDSISRNAFDTLLYRFNVPDLRVGTLDSLLALSDDLLKSNSFVEGVSHKIRRQIEELEKAAGVESGTLTVDGVPIDSYITRFTWDEAKYPTMSPLREIIDVIHAQIVRIEDDLKVRVAEYNNVRGQLNAISRKQSGSLAVRDLSDLVKPDDIIASENLVTLVAVVPKYSQKDWLSSYETLTNFVVRSFLMFYMNIMTYTYHGHAGIVTGRSHICDPYLLLDEKMCRISAILQLVACYVSVIRRVL
ncbi:unnamed protein product [Victoria cruziana]